MADAHVGGSSRRPIPILYVHWGDEGIRGSERVLLDILAEIDRERFTPILWCNAETLADAARSLDLPVHVQPMSILLGWDRPRWNVRAFLELVDQGRRLIRASGAAIVHVSSGAPNQWMAIAARRERVPLMAHLHALYRFRERCTLLLHQAPMIVGCSDAVVAPFRRDRVSPERLRIVHNGVSPARVARGDARGLRASLGIGGNAIVLAGAGALVPLKGFQTLIEAVALVRTRGIDVHAVIAGEGPEREKLVALGSESGVADRVHFLGQRDDVGAVFRDAADIVVVPSSVESFGLAAAEAGVTGRPTVASRVGGLPELIDDGVTGVLVPAGSAEAFAEAISTLALDRGLRVRMGAAARSRVAQHFTTKQLAHGIEKLYRELLSSSPPRHDWSRPAIRTAPFIRLAAAVAGRRIGLSVTDL